ncbi:MAG: hypothetical protein ACOVO2_16945 [Emticicia sp.]|uniref:hypothetical protein n=1 Tax=Emticicia sp. TaxID=1930953 RepID=UPI003BA3EC6A
MVKIINIIVAVLIVIINVYFIKTSSSIIFSGGGGMGWGLVFLPISISINLFLITAFLILKKSKQNSIFLLTLNSLGLFWSLFWFYQIHIS